MPPPDDKELIRRETILKEAEAKARKLLEEYNVVVARYRVCAEQVLEIKNRLNNTKSSVATIAIKVELIRAEARQELAIDALMKKQEEHEGAKADSFGAKLHLDEYVKSMKQPSTPKPKQQDQRPAKATNKEAEMKQRIEETRMRAEEELRARAKERSHQREVEAKWAWEQRKKEHEDEAKKRSRDQSTKREPDFARMQNRRDKAEEEQTRQRSRTPGAQREAETARMQNSPRHAEEQTRSRSAQRSAPKVPGPSPLREKPTGPDENVKFLSEEHYAQKKKDAERIQRERIRAAAEEEDQARLRSRERTARQEATAAYIQEKRKQAAEQAKKQRAQQPPPVPPHRANPQHHDDDNEVYKAWRQDAEEAFKDYTAMETFPTPPFPDIVCNKPACLLSRPSRALKICACDIEKAIKGAGRPIKEERKCWHPDKFSTCREEVRGGFQAKAKEVFQVVVGIYAVEGEAKE